MKIVVKPLMVTNWPDVPPIQVIVGFTMAPRATLVARSYQQLVTFQGVDPERAKALLGLQK